MRSLKIGRGTRETAERESAFPTSHPSIQPPSPPNPGTYPPNTLTLPSPSHHRLASRRSRPRLNPTPKGRSSRGSCGRISSVTLASSASPSGLACFFPSSPSFDPLSPHEPSSSSRLPSPPPRCPTACFVRPSERAVLTKLSFSPAPLWSPLHVLSSSFPSPSNTPLHPLQRSESPTLLLGLVDTFFFTGWLEGWTMKVDVLRKREGARPRRGGLPFRAAQHVRRARVRRSSLLSCTPSGISSLARRG